MMMILKKNVIKKLNKNLEIKQNISDYKLKEISLYNQIKKWQKRKNI